AGPPPGQIEINESFRVIEERLGALGVPLQRKSKKTGPGGEYIELSFLTPEIGRRHQELLDELSEYLRWSIRVNPRPNQLGLQELALRLIPARGRVPKGPSFFGELRLLRMRVDGLDEEALREIEAEFERRTGYRLELE